MMSKEEDRKQKRKFVDLVKLLTLSTTCMQSVSNTVCCISLPCNHFKACIMPRVSASIRVGVPLNQVDLASTNLP
jgi:hypothetical protein